MYVPYNPNPCGLSTGDCTVRAISKALNISWDDAHDILSEFAKNMCDMAHKDLVWGAVLRVNGFHRSGTGIFILRGRYTSPCAKFARYKLDFVK